MNAVVVRFHAQKNFTLNHLLLTVFCATGVLNLFYSMYYGYVFMHVVI